MKVVLDTNVVVSGTFWMGTSFKVLELVNQGKIDIIVTLPILEEYYKIIHSGEILDKIDIYQQARIKSLQEILSKAIVVEPKEKIEFVKDDPDDDKFLEAAVEGKVNFLISRDKKHLLILNKFRDIPIITPEQFLKTLK